MRINPAHRARLESLGLSDAADFLELPGEIVSGHPDRHVMRVQLGGTRAYLKREHRVPLADRLTNWWAGFGMVSVSFREAAMLERLREQNVPAAAWLAAGEDAQGRAFLLLAEAAGAIDLRQHLLRLAPQQRRERRRLAHRLGGLIAQIHNQRIEYPDLYAKHILIHPVTGELTLLDWQRARQLTQISWRERCRELAALNASIADELAGRAERLAFLAEYLRRSGSGAPPVAAVCRLIERRMARLLKRSNVREQRLPVVAESQPLIWLDGEAICVTLRCQAMLSASELERFAYPQSQGRNGFLQSRFVDLPDGGRARLACRRTVRRLSQVRNWVRGQRWTAPELRAGAELSRRERVGERPRLLAFGQRCRSWGVIDSFLLADAEGRGE
ncbi:MAG: lipopolysaccharide kinase InaA family protein [Gemmataceae bacterium]